MSSQEVLAHLSSLENILHEFEELKEWYKGDEPLEIVLDKLIKSNQLKHKKIEVDSHVYNIYWLPFRDFNCKRIETFETPPSKRLIRGGASRSLKRSRSNFVSPLLSKRTKTSDEIAQKLSFDAGIINTSDDKDAIVSAETSGSQSDKNTDSVPSVVDTSLTCTNDDKNVIVSAETCSQPDEPTTTDTSLLMKRKEELQCALAEKEEKLRKLRMVKLYRSKNDLDHLEKLISKWREVSQEAAEELLKMTTHPDTSLRQLLDYLHIDYDTIHYSIEDDAFY